MKTTGGSDDQKRRAGDSAADLAEDGMVVGLGTGSTSAHAIRALGRAVDAGLDIHGVATSFASKQLAREVGVPLTDLDGTDRIDLAIDGADQVAARTLLKGGGAAHAREKFVASAADRVVVVADPSKLADGIDRPVPVEVLPAARAIVGRKVREAGGDPVLRAAKHKDGPVVTDNGNLVFDCDFGTIDDPATLDTRLSCTSGVVEHGLFVEVADEVHVGGTDGVDVVEF